MINEWKDYYNNDYIIFSINNGIVNDQYFSTKHILNTYQSRVEFIIDNIEDFSFKNEDYINTIENDFHINYAQQVLEVEENENKKEKDHEIEVSNKIENDENAQPENFNTNDLKNLNEKTNSSEEPIMENNENNIISDDFLKEEDFAIDHQNHNREGKRPELGKDTADGKIELISENETNGEPNYSNKTQSEIYKEEKIIHKEATNLPFPKPDNNRKIDFKDFNNLDNLPTVSDSNVKSSSIEKTSQKDLKIEIEKNESSNKDSKESPEKYERKKDNYKTLINNLKSQEQTDENNNYYSRKDKIENKKTSKNIYVNNIPNPDKIIDRKEINSYQKDNENENLQISNSLNSNNSQDFNNINSENNEIPDYDKYPKICSRAQSYTTRSRDDEIKSLNDKLYSYKNQNKIILDENKKLLEIINIFKILQNLENSKKNTNSNNIDSVNKNLNLDSDGINREIENINKNNELILKKESSVVNLIKSEGNNLKQEDKFLYNNNQAFDNYGLLEFEKFTKNDKRLIRNIDFSYANKFLNSNHYVMGDTNINKPIKDEKIYKIENAPINNRYENINESSTLNFKNNLMLSDQKNEDENQYQEQRHFKNSINSSNQNPENHINFNSDVISNVSEIIVKNNFVYNKNFSTNNQNINISVTSSNNLISPSSYDSTKNINSVHNKKKTFIRIDDNFQNKGGNYSKNYKIFMNSTKSNNNDKLTISDKKTNNKVSYINTNSIPTINSKINSGSNKSKTNATQSSLVFSNYPDSPENRRINPNNNRNNKADENKKSNGENNIFENKNNFPLIHQAPSNGSYSENIYVNSRKIDNDNYTKNTNYPNFSKTFQDNKQNNVLDVNKDDKELKNYNHLIQYLEKYKELNDKLIETLENEKNDVEIDVNKRKKDVEYLEHILNYISSLGDNNKTKDFIPFYLIDKRKLFENMVKYLYSKDEMTHPNKYRNVRLYKIHNKLK